MGLQTNLLTNSLALGNLGLLDFLENIFPNSLFLEYSFRPQDFARFMLFPSLNFAPLKSKRAQPKTTISEVKIVEFIGIYLH